MQGSLNKSTNAGINTGDFDGSKLVKMLHTHPPCSVVYIAKFLIVANGPFSGWYS